MTARLPGCPVKHIIDVAIPYECQNEKKNVWLKYSVTFNQVVGDSRPPTLINGGSTEFTVYPLLFFIQSVADLQTS